MSEDKPVRFKKMRQSCAAIVLIVGLFLIVVHWFQFDGLASVTLVPPWLLLIPAVLLTLMSTRAISRTQFSVLIGLMLVFAFLFVEEARSLLRFGSLAKDKPTMVSVIRIATLNCNMGQVEAAIEPMAWQPDVVLLQESPGLPAVEELASEYFGADGSVLHSTDASMIVNGKIEPVHFERGTHFVHGVATLTNGQKVDVVSLRLSAPVFRLDFYSSGFWADHTKTRQKHREELEEVVSHLRVNAKTDTWIVGGDFNLVGNDGALSAFASLRDSFFQGGSGWGNTGTSDYPLFRVDQIWATPNVRCPVSKAIPTRNSDHRMVVADLQLGNDK